jgi:small subunit ribosomal protein S8
MQVGNMVDQVANMLSKIKNCIMSSKRVVDRVPNTKVNRSVLNAMHKDGYIEGYDFNEGDKFLEIKIKYDAKGIPVIRAARKISKLSRRIYTQAKDIDKLVRTHKFSTFILSTNQGMIADVDAKNLGIGGEVICEVAS